MDLERLFPDHGCGIRPSRHELERFADYWDDDESELTNVAAITWWLDRTDVEANNLP